MILYLPPFLTTIFKAINFTLVIVAAVSYKFWYVFSLRSLISLVTSFLSHELFRSVLFVNYLGSLSNLFYDQIFITSIFINLLILVVKHMFSWWMFHVHLKIYILKLLNIVFFESAFNQLCRLCFSSCSKYSNILSSCFISYQEYNVENALLLLHNYLLIF